jgi:Dihaem cytochrome c
MRLASRHIVSPWLATLTVSIFGVCMFASTIADDGRRTPSVPLAPKYQQECASCHIAYPPGMLPPASWQRLMGGLQRHYGTDASLDAATTKELSAWLTANGGTYKRVREQPPEDRITKSQWFLNEHRKVNTATWRLPDVRSSANCGACHTQANQGDFRERNIRFPR